MRQEKTKKFILSGVVCSTLHALRQKIQEKGYDSLIYMNEKADRGSMGVIVLDPSQLTLVSIDGKPIDENTKTTDTFTKTIENGEKSGTINYKLNYRSMNVHADNDSSVFDVEEIEENLSKTNVGKSALEYIDENNMFVTFNYDKNVPPNICGSISGKDITVYSNNCEDLQDVCGTIIHEVSHEQFDWKHTQEGETNCYLMELLHKKESISENDIQKIVEFVKKEYSNLPEGDLYGY